MQVLRKISSLLLVLASISLLSTPALALTRSALQLEPDAIIELLEGQIRVIESSGELDEAGKTDVLDSYRKSISLVEQRQTYERATAKFVKAREQAPKQAAALREELGNLEAEAAQKLPDSLERKSLATLEQLLLSEKSDLTGLSTNLAGLNGLLEAQNQRSLQIRENLNQAKQRQPVVLEALQIPAPTSEPQRLTEARRWGLELELLTLSRQIEMLEQELLSQPMRVELFGVRRDMATLELNRQLQFVELFESLVVERRRSEAASVREEVEETERQSFGKHHLLQEIAQNNALLGQELNRLAGELERVIAEENLAATRAKRVTDNFRLSRQKLEIAGMSEALGQVLLEQRRSLPDFGDFKAAEKRRQHLVVDSSLRQIRNQQERTRMRDINLYVDDLMAALSDTWKKLLRVEVLEFTEARRDLLDRAIAAEDTYLQALGELDFTQRLLSETVSAYNKFLAERLLWIRTGKAPSWEMLKAIGESVEDFVALEHWLELGSALVSPDSFPWVLLVGLALFAVLMKYRPSLRGSLERTSRQVGQIRHDRIYYTLKALAVTLVLALPWPVLFATLGLHLRFVQGIETLDLEAALQQSGEWSGQFVPAIGDAFSDLAPYAFYFFAFREFCDDKGFAVTHFKWDLSATSQLRDETRGLMLVFLPVIFLLIASTTYDPAALAGGLSRLFFVIAMVALAWFFGRILTPKNGVMREFYSANPNNPLSWFRYLWVLLGVSLPIMLGVLATVGYVYTAAMLTSRLVDTLWLIVAIILIHQMVVRWVLLVERRLEFNDALERHRAQRAAKEALDGEAAVDSISFEEPEVDFSALSEDAKKLISAAITIFAGLGLWAIWRPVLPAFRLLNDVALWTYTTTVDGADKILPVTLNDAILGLLLIIIGIVTARRLPGLLEIVLLARLNITAGSRYAISSLTQYAIVSVVIVMTFSLVGGSWSEIQWLIAALGVGIGFGLQEIVANFICGLILLFERPIRIGDIVTVGETSGIVTRIQIRSTTIRNWDQQELLVPNKEFITGRLLNWTLSDPMARIVIPVGIAYGSDVGLALKLVQETAEQNERVLDDPAPLVILESFGDNSLNITLRCYIASMDFRLLTLSELNQTINQKFAEAGIVIAFPQHDVHLDTSEPLDIRIHQAQPESQGAT